MNYKLAQIEDLEYPILVYKMFKNLSDAYTYCKALNEGLVKISQPKQIENQEMFYETGCFWAVIYEPM